jgi:hypothetical protein
MKDDDRIIRHRIAGHSGPKIAKTRRTTVCEVNGAIDRWADSTITDKTRKHTLALELARLDELQETFYARALEGDDPMRCLGHEDHRVPVRDSPIGSSGRSTP